MDFYDNHYGLSEAKRDRKVPATPHVHLSSLLSLTVAITSAKAWWATYKAPLFPVTWSEKQKLWRILNIALTSYKIATEEAPGNGMLSSTKYREHSRVRMTETTPPTTGSPSQVGVEQDTWLRGDETELQRFLGLDVRKGSGCFVTFFRAGDNVRSLLQWYYCQALGPGPKERPRVAVLNQKTNSRGCL